MLTELSNNTQSEKKTGENWGILKFYTENLSILKFHNYQQSNLNPLMGDFQNQMFISVM